jgi:hypothetical protein
MRSPSFLLLALCLGARTGAAQTSIPLWTQTIAPCPVTTAAPAAPAPTAALPPCGSRDANSHSITMAGRNPFLHGHVKTAVKTLLISMKVTFGDNNIVLDASVASGRLVDKNKNKISVTQATNNSPIFQPTTWTMNGVNIGGGVAGGKLQYADAFQRANFWLYVGGTPYQTMLSPVAQDAESYTAAATSFKNCQNNANYGPCGRLDINAWDAFARTLITTGTTNNGANAPQAITPDTFVIFVFDSVAFELNTVTSIPGYHTSFVDGLGNNRTYAVADFDTSGELAATAPDVMVISHEVGEWMDDPIINTPNVASGEGGQGGNQVPGWGPYGQVDTCQGNLEVGDPTSQPSPNPPVGGGKKLTPTNFSSTLNNFTYHLQELTYFSWFLGAPSVAAGNGFSNNGTFTQDAGPVCKP